MRVGEFLLARLAEDEASLKNATDYECWQGVDREFAEIEAKRRIVELRYSWNLQAERTPEPPFGPILKAQVITADTVLRALAVVYAEHPDYREDWPE